jgi:hypothetical protein
MNKFQKTEFLNIKKVMRIGFCFKTSKKLIRKHFNNLDSWLFLKRINNI